MANTSSREGRPPLKGNAGPEATYFGIQAHVGITKHGGSLSATREFIQLCHIKTDSLVLDVGCGVGATSCYLAKKIGCRVVGVDIREDLVARARERAQRETNGNRWSF